MKLSNYLTSVVPALTFVGGGDIEANKFSKILI